MSTRHPPPAEAQGALDWLNEANTALMAARHERYRALLEAVDTGATLQDITEALGIRSRGTAHALVRRARAWEDQQP